MTKLNEEWIYEDVGDRLIVKQTHDPNPILDSVAAMKSDGITGTSDKRHVGRVPFFLIEQWVNDAGLSFDDTDAVQDLMHKKLLSGEFNALRPWQGSY